MMLRMTDELDSREILSVTELTRSVRALLEDEIGEVWVEGEISNYRHQASGHRYFTLKDENSQVSCVLFRGAASGLRGIDLEDGLEVQLFGRVTVYEARGQYQINVRLVQRRGMGALQAKFEALKRRLDSEGLFDPALKKKLPRFPRNIGIVTSPTGAAVRDMLNVLHRRAPWVGIIVNPVRVQGEGAAEEIVAAIDEFCLPDETGLPPVEVIVVTRGGGSMEDLWAFNEEIVARAIHRAGIPVVSAVGHEIDFTIADFVADHRVPTPSAAAEVIVPDSADLRRRFADMLARMNTRLLGTVKEQREKLVLLARGTLVREPRRMLEEVRQALDFQVEMLGREASARLERERNRLKILVSEARRHRPDRLIETGRQSLARLNTLLNERSLHAIEKMKGRLNELGSVVRILGPQATLERGYSITTDAEGAVIYSFDQVKEGAGIKTRLSKGFLHSVVKEALLKEKAK